MKAHNRAMFQYRRGGRIGRASNTSPTERGGSSLNRTSGAALQALKSTKGKFENGTWKCNCTPRLPAERFQVKKQTRNFGRWFYTCQKSSDERCDFFLWEDDAKPREQAAVLGNSNTEPGASQSFNSKPNNETRKSPPKNTVEARPAPPLQPQTPRAAPASPPPKTGTKRKLPWKQDSPVSEGYQASSVPEYSDADAETEDEDTFPWPLTGEEEQALTKAVDTVSATTTPRKATKTDAFATPGGDRRGPVDTGLPTPGTTLTHKAGADEQRRLNAATDDTPTPSRFRDALASPSLMTPSKASSSDLTAEAFTLLHSNNLTPDSSTSAALRSLLDRHELRTQGVAKGREISRLALKARDARIAELTRRNAALETEVEVVRAENRRLKDTARTKN